ncbi:MAG: cell division protein FtsQ/DivIB [Marmoricola sp.]
MTMLEDEVAEDETVMIAAPDFARRRLRAKLRRLRPFLYAGLVLVLAVVGTWLVAFSSVLAVRGVDVSGNTSVSSARIARLAQAPVGTPLARADLAPIQARLEAIPSIRSVVVSRSWPHTIKIVVTERTPVAVVSRGAGLQAVDASGVLFGHYAKKPAGLPLVNTSPSVRADALAEVARVVSSLRPDIAAKVKHVDVETVDKISLEMADGVEVVWGSAAESEQKAEVLVVLLAQKKVGQIDVSVPGRPTTR